MHAFALLFVGLVSSLLYVNSLVFAAFIMPLVWAVLLGALVFRVQGPVVTFSKAKLKAALDARVPLLVLVAVAPAYLIKTTCDAIVHFTTTRFALVLTVHVVVFAAMVDQSSIYQLATAVHSHILRRFATLISTQVVDEQRHTWSTIFIASLAAVFFLPIRHRWLHAAACLVCGLAFWGVAGGWGRTLMLLGVLVAGIGALTNKINVHTAETPGAPSPPIWEKPAQLMEKDEEDEEVKGR